MNFKKMFSLDRLVLMSVMAALGLLADILLPIVEAYTRKGDYYNEISYFTWPVEWAMVQLAGPKGWIVQMLAVMGAKDFAYAYELFVSNTNFSQLAWHASVGFVMTLFFALVLVITVLIIVGVCRFCITRCARVWRWLRQQRRVGLIILAMILITVFVHFVIYDLTPVRRYLQDDFAEFYELVREHWIVVGAAVVLIGAALLWRARRRPVDPVSGATTKKWVWKWPRFSFKTGKLSSVLGWVWGNLFWILIGSAVALFVAYPLIDHLSWVEAVRRFVTSLLS